MSNFNLSHLNFLTDDFGIWQFCSKSGILKKYDNYQMARPL